MPKANSIWILGDHLPANLGAQVVVWPPDGYVPLFLIPTSKRVSVALEGADFTFARVDATIAGRPAVVTDQRSDAWYGHPAVSFRLAELPELAVGDADISVVVKVSGLQLNGNDFMWQHESKLFDPTDTVVPAGEQGNEAVARTDADIECGTRLPKLECWRRQTAVRPHQRNVPPPQHATPPGQLRHGQPQHT